MGGIFRGFGGARLRLLGDLIGGWGLWLMLFSLYIGFFGGYLEGKKGI